jgi:hypothetical protein
VTRRVLSLIALAVALAAPFRPAAAAETHVGYLAGGSVYVESGRLDGINEGDTLTVLRDGAVLGRLVARFLSSHRAACDTLGVASLPRVGDTVRFTARAAKPDSLAAARPAAGAAAAESLAAAARRPARRVRGRVGGSWLVLRSQAGGGYSQPALDLRLDARGTGTDFEADVRSHRTYIGGTANDQDLGRIYRMSLSFHDEVGSRRLTLGRQVSPSLAVVSLFDGALASLNGRRWGAGLFTGTQPDPVRYGVSGDILESGGYAEWRSVPLAARRWSLTGGGIASFDHGNPNRNYFFTQGFYADRRLTAIASQEVDLYPGWARALGEPAVSLSSTFLSGRLQATRMLSVDAGYDSRRNVRLYRDRVTPETEFDDRYRNGTWLGAAVEPNTHLRIEGDARYGSGGDGGNYHTWTTSGELYRLPLLQADLRLRSTRFVGDFSTEWLLAGGLTVRPLGQTDLNLTAGTRSTQDVLSGLETRVAWVGADLSAGFARNWYLTLSGDRDHGDGIDQIQLYYGLSRLF